MTPRTKCPAPSRLPCAWLVLLLAGGLAACVPAPPSPETAKKAEVAPPGFPAAHYRQIEARGGKVLRVDGARSLVVVEVGRAGSLARLGHDHVVASHDLQGYVAPEEGRADLYLPLERLVVDEPGLRAEAGFDTQPSKAAIEGTRRNMLDKVLEVERYPFVLIRASRQGPRTLQVAITLHGTTREWEIPVCIENLPEGLAVSGKLAIKQMDFGITPFSVLSGAMQVRDRLDLRFRIVATP